MLKDERQSLVFEPSAFIHCQCSCGERFHGFGAKGDADYAIWTEVHRQCAPQGPMKDGYSQPMRTHGN